MIVTIGGIPVYNALISDEDTGMIKISLVDDPAVMSNFQAFDNTRKPMMYAIQDEKKRLVRGVVMRADFPIYRYSDDMGEYYIIYKAEEIRKMAEKYLLESRQNNVNLMHEEGSDVEGVQMVQYFIKGAGVAVEGFDDIADGSLFAEFHIVNDEVWDAIKEGTYKGFSLEGYFELQPEEDEEGTEEIVRTLEGKFGKERAKKLLKNIDKMKKNKIKALIAQLVQEVHFNSITTDKGILNWDGEDEIKVGDKVFVEDADGNEVVAEDNDYRTEDGRLIVVADGVVVEIKEAETFAEVVTDKGTLSYEGELAVGVEVFVEGEGGERLPAPDGEYVAEDNRTIVVTEGKVAEIREEQEPTPTPEEEIKAKRMRIVEAFADTYDEKIRKIINAIETLVGNFYGYIVEASDEHAILCVWNEAEDAETLVRYDITWDADGNAVASNPTKVVPTFVEEGAEPSAPAPSAEEEALRKENAELKAEVERLQKMSAAKPAHQVALSGLSQIQTGDKGLDNLARLLSAK